MDINAYLPDELGQRAKDADLAFSQLLRKAVRIELEHREYLDGIRGKTEVHEMLLDGGITVRLRAKEQAWDGANQWLYVTEGGDVYVHDAEAQALYGFQETESAAIFGPADPDNWAHGNLDFYAALMEALGEPVVIEIG